MTDPQPVKIEIYAPAFEVGHFLEQTLSESELAALEVRYLPVAPDVLAPERQGEYEVARAVIEFLAGAAASGGAYDLMKKLAQAAVARFGKEKVKEK